jgi:hypothetical protein
VTREVPLRQIAIGFLTESDFAIADHPAAGFDDLINSAAGALVLAASAERRRAQWWFGSEDANRQLAAIRGVEAPQAAPNIRWSKDPTDRRPDMCRRRPHEGRLIMLMNGGTSTEPIFLSERRLCVRTAYWRTCPR